MAASSHILINGLSIGSGGGYTVARELLRHLTVARPEWRATLALIRGHPLHEKLNHETWPANASLLYAPSAAIARWRRLSGRPGQWCTGKSNGAEVGATGLSWCGVREFRLKLWKNCLTVPEMRPKA